MSRAKDQLWLFHSIDTADLGANCYRRVLLDYCRNPRVGRTATPEGLDVDVIRRAVDGRREIGNQPRPFDSWFEADVFLRIVDRGFRVIPQYEAGGYFIDLMVQGIDGSLAVECDGEKWHGPEQYEADVNRQRKLERCGLRFWRVTESAFRRDPDAVLDGLWTRLADLGIYSEAEEATRRVENSASSQESSSSKDDAWEDTALGSEAHIVDSPPPAYAELELDFGMKTESTTPRTPPSVGELSELRPYTEWAVRRLPDPRTASSTLVQAGLLEILQSEGPICVDRLFRLYARGAGIQRVKERVRASLDAAMGVLARNGDINRRTETLPGFGDYDSSVNVVWIAGKPDVIVRRRGSRDLEEVPLTELVEALALLSRRNSSVLKSSEATVRAIQHAYELGRVSAPARERFEAVARKLSMTDGYRH